MGTHHACAGSVPSLAFKLRAWCENRERWAVGNVRAHSCSNWYMHAQLSIGLLLAFSQFVTRDSHIDPTRTFERDEHLARASSCSANESVQECAHVCSHLPMNAKLEPSPPAPVHLSARGCMSDSPACGDTLGCYGFHDELTTVDVL
jgi:hypothetical protein